MSSIQELNENWVECGAKTCGECAYVIVKENKAICRKYRCKIAHLDERREGLQYEDACPDFIQV